MCAGRYNCNRFNEKESKDARDLQAVSWLVASQRVPELSSAAVASSSGEISLLLQSLHESHEESADGEQGRPLYQ